MLPLIKRRIMETFIAEIVLSVFFAGLFYYGVLDQMRGQFFVASIVCIILNLIFLSICINIHYLAADKPKKTICLLINVIAMMIPSFMGIVLTLFETEPLYTWLFFPYKFLYTTYGFPKIVSSLFVSMIFVGFSVLQTMLLKTEETQPPAATKTYEVVDEQIINDENTDNTYVDEEFVEDEIIDAEDMGEYDV